MHKKKKNPNTKQNPPKKRPPLKKQNIKPQKAQTKTPVKIVCNMHYSHLKYSKCPKE